MLILITDRRDFGKELASILMDQGIFTFECPLETGAFFCEEKDTGGVLLDCTTSLEAGEALCRQLRQTYPELPILMLTSPESIPWADADMILRDAPLPSLLPDVLEFCRRVCGWSDEPLSSYFLTVGDTPDQVFYMGYPLLLPPKAYRLLQCLFYRYPALTSTEDLMALCYPEGHEQAGNLAVQIHRINQCAAKIDPRPLVVNQYGKGYRLRSGIL